MASLAVMVVIALQLVAGAVAQSSGNCSSDICFVKAEAPDSCCLLNYPEIAAVAESSSFEESATALTTLVSAVCTEECFTPIFGAYKDCLIESNVAVEQANTYLPDGLCELSCVTEGLGLSLAELSNCTTLETVPQLCREDIAGIEGPIGDNMINLFEACNIDIFRGGDQPKSSGTAPMMAPTAAPAVAPAALAPAPAAAAPSAALVAAPAPSRSFEEELDEEPLEFADKDLSDTDAAPATRDIEVPAPSDNNAAGFKDGFALMSSTLAGAAALSFLAMV